MAPPAVNSGCFGDRVCLVPVFGLHESIWLPAIGYGRSDSAVGWDDTWTGGGHPNTNGDALDGKWVQVYSNGGWWDTCRSHELQNVRILQKITSFKSWKNPDFQVTLCLQNVFTNVDFAYIESE